MTRRSSLAAWFLLVIVVGCQGSGNPFGPPGTMRQQQLNATLHDPYADNEAGPEVVGGRPREYQKPLAEPVRSRSIRDLFFGR